MGSLVFAFVSAVAFLIIELFLSPEPILAPYLLRQKIPLLSGASNFLVANCNFAIIYFFPLWFQTVLLTSASTAGESCILSVLDTSSILGQEHTFSRIAWQCLLVLYSLVGWCTRQESIRCWIWSLVSFPSLELPRFVWLMKSRGSFNRGLAS